jgi:uncharacterized alpha-E superfamily protein
MMDLFKHHEDPIVRAFVELIGTVIERLDIMSKSLDALTAQVAANVAAETAAIDAIKAGANDSAQLDALAGQLKTSADALTAALGT